MSNILFCHIKHLKHFIKHVAYNINLNGDHMLELIKNKFKLLIFFNLNLNIHISLQLSIY